jgi:Na+-driven multidrug efflux pump
MLAKSFFRIPLSQTGYTEIPDPILNKSSPVISRAEAVKTSFIKTVTMAASFTLTLSWLVIQVIAARLEKEGESDIRAAMPLIIAFMNFLSPNSFILFSMSAKLSPEFGKLRYEELQGADLLLLNNDEGIPQKYANTEKVILCKITTNPNLLRAHLAQDSPSSPSNVSYTFRDSSGYQIDFKDLPDITKGTQSLEELCRELNIFFPETESSERLFKKAFEYKDLYEALQKLQPQTVRDFTPNQIKLTEIRKEITKVTQNGMKLTLPVMLLTAAAMYFSESILIALKQPQEIAALAQTYLRANAPGAALLVFRISLEQIFFADKKFFHVMITMWIAFLMGTAAAIYLSLGKPQLGLVGIAYGYDINAILDCVFLMGLLVRDPTFKEITFFRGWTFLNQEDRQKIKALFSLGLSIAFQYISEFSSLFAMTIFAGHLGKEALLIQSYYMMLWFLALIVIFAAGATLSNLIGFSRGEGKYLDANRYAIWGLITTALTVLGITLPTSLFPESLTYLIGKTKPETMLKLEYILPIVGGTLMLDSLRNPIGTILRGNGDPVWPTISAAAPLWIGVLLGWLLETQTKMGILGGVIGYAAGILGGMVPILWRSVIKLTPEALLSFTQQQKGLQDATNVIVPVNDSAGSVNTPAEKSIWETCSSCLFGSRRATSSNDEDNGSLLTLDRKAAPAPG